MATFLSAIEQTSHCFPTTPSDNIPTFMDSWSVTTLPVCALEQQTLLLLDCAQSPTHHWWPGNPGQLGGLTRRWKAFKGSVSVESPGARFGPRGGEALPVLIMQPLKCGIWTWEWSCFTAALQGKQILVPHSIICPYTQRTFQPR